MKSSVFSAAAILFCLALSAIPGCGGNDGGDGDDFAFMVLGDSRGPNSGIYSFDPYVKLNWQFLAYVANTVVPEFDPAFVLFSGDMNTDYNDSHPYMELWKQHFSDPLSNMGIPCYPVKGNHEIYGTFEFVVQLAFPTPGLQEKYQDTFRDFFSANNLNNGPSSAYNGLAYWFTYKNSFFAAFDTFYVINENCPPFPETDIPMKSCFECVPFDPREGPEGPNYGGCITNAQRNWLSGLSDQMEGYTHRFALGHAPMYPLELHKVLEINEQAWQVMEDMGFGIYFAGHDHLYSRKRIESPEFPSATGKIVQVSSGAAGAVPDSESNVFVNIEDFHISFVLNFVIVRVKGNEVISTAYVVTGSGEDGIDPPYTYGELDQFSVAQP